MTTEQSQEQAFTHCDPLRYGIYLCFSAMETNRSKCNMCSDTRPVAKRDSSHLVEGAHPSLEDDLGTSAAVLRGR